MLHSVEIKWNKSPKSNANSVPHRLATYVERSKSVSYEVHDYDYDYVGRSEAAH